MQGSIVLLASTLSLCLLTGCYDRAANGKLILGSSVSLYTLEDQQSPIATTTPLLHENPFFNGLVNFAPLPEAYSADDGFYLVIACGGHVDGVPQEDCRHILVASKYFFVPAASDGWDGFSALWNMTPVTDAIARAIKDTFSHQSAEQIRAALDASVGAMFGQHDSNEDGVVSYDDIAFSPTTDYARNLGAGQVDELHTDTLLNFVLASEDLDLGDGVSDDSGGGLDFDYGY